MLSKLEIEEIEKWWCIAATVKNGKYAGKKQCVSTYMLLNDANRWQPDEFLQTIYENFQVVKYPFKSDLLED